MVLHMPIHNEIRKKSSQLKEHLVHLGSLYLRLSTFQRLAISQNITKNKGRSDFNIFHCQTIWKPISLHPPEMPNEETSETEYLAATSLASQKAFKRPNSALKLPGKDQLKYNRTSDSISYLFMSSACVNLA